MRYTKFNMHSKADRSQFSPKHDTSKK